MANFRDRAFEIMKNDRTLSTEEAFALAGGHDQEAATVKLREDASRPWTQSDPRAEGALRVASKFGIDIVDAYSVASAVQADPRLDAPLAALLSDKQIPVARAIDLARTEVAGGKPSTGPMSVSDLTLQLQRAEPSLDIHAATTMALKLRATPGAAEGALLRIASGVSTSAAVDAACGRG